MAIISPGEPAPVINDQMFKIVNICGNVLPVCGKATILIALPMTSLEMLNTPPTLDSSLASTSSSLSLKYFDSAGLPFEPSSLIDRLRTSSPPSGSMLASSKPFILRVSVPHMSKTKPVPTAFFA